MFDEWRSREQHDQEFRCSLVEYVAVKAPSTAISALLGTTGPWPCLHG